MTSNSLTILTYLLTYLLGKLETYIRRFCPDVLAQLLEAGVLTE
jgi:hypothetical protein